MTSAFDRNIILSCIANDKEGDHALYVKAFDSYINLLMYFEGR